MSFNPFDPFDNQRNQMLNQHHHQMMSGLGNFGMGVQTGIGMGTQLQNYSNKKSESSDLLLLTIEGDTE